MDWRTSVISPLSVHAPDAGSWRFGDKPDLVFRILKDELAPVVELGPPALHFGEVDLPVDIHEFQHMEEIDGAAAVGRSDEIGEWACT